MNVPHLELSWLGLLEFRQDCSSVVVCCVKLCKQTLREPRLCRDRQFLRSGGLWLSSLVRPLRIACRTWRATLIWSSSSIAVVFELFHGHWVRHGQERGRKDVCWEQQWRSRLFYWPITCDMQKQVSTCSNSLYLNRDLYIVLGLGLLNLRHIR